MKKIQRAGYCLLGVAIASPLPFITLGPAYGVAVVAFSAMTVVAIVLAIEVWG